MKRNQDMSAGIDDSTKSGGSIKRDFKRSKPLTTDAADVTGNRDKKLKTHVAKGSVKSSDARAEMSPTD